MSTEQSPLCIPRIGLPAAAALLAGAVWALHAPTTLSPNLAWALLAVGAAAWQWCWPLRIPGLLALGYGLATLHAGQVMAHTLPAEWDRKTATLIATVTDLPQLEPKGARWRMRVESSPLPTLRHQSIRVSYYPSPKDSADGGEDFASRIHVGQRWRLTVQLRAPRSLINPGGFDSERQAFAQRLVATAILKRPETARLLESRQGLNAWREGMSARIAATTTSPYARFIRGLALGDTRSLTDSDWTILRNDGLTHLIAISGSHVGFVGAMFALLVGAWLRLFPRVQRALPRPIAMSVAAAGGGLLYCAVTGNEAPTLRTALMMAVLAVAAVQRRRIAPLDLLALVVMLMVLFDPLAVMGAGFWLSMLGVGWLMAVMPSHNEGTLRTFMRTQFVATFALMPVAMLWFGQVSIAGSLANWIAVPWWSGVVVPLALIGTALEALMQGAGAWAWSLASWAFGLTWPLFEWIAARAWSMAWMPSVSLAVLLIACVGTLWMTMPRGMPMRWLGLVGMVPLFWPWLPRPAYGEIELRLIDVGQGLSVYLRTHRTDALYDAGPAKPGGRDEGELSVLPSLRAIGVRRLAWMMLSHGDNDHAGGAASVRRGMPVQTVWAPQGAKVPESQRCFRGQRWQQDGVRFEVLWPLRGSPYLANDSSCVLRIESRSGVALLTGDIGVDVERELVRLNAAQLRAQLVSAPHHGSLTSSSDALIRAAGAKWVLGGTGYRNMFRHPRPAVVKRWHDAGARFPVTADYGMLTATPSPQGWKVTALREQRPRLWDAQRHRQGSAVTVSYEDDRSGL